MKLTETFEYKNKTYTISGENNDEEFVVIRASWLPDGKKLVEEIRTVEATSVDKIKRLIRLGRYKNFKKM